MQANKRISTAHAKDRSEVRGGGKKPWRQKGTGRARHGSSRSPIWRTGGVTHGPRADRDFSQKVNKKAKIKALAVAISQKLRGNQMVFVDTLDLDSGKTKVAHDVITAISTLDGFATIDNPNPNNIFIVWPESTELLTRSFRNLPNVTFTEARNLNPVHILNHRYVIVVNPQQTSAILDGRFDQAAKRKSVESTESVTAQKDA